MSNVLACINGPLIRIKPQAESSNQEVLAGLVERVTFHNADNGFCPLAIDWNADGARTPNRSKTSAFSLFFCRKQGVFSRKTGRRLKTNGDPVREQWLKIKTNNRDKTGRRISETGDLPDFPKIKSRSPAPCRSVSGSAGPAHP
jgi:hypothetical protein